MNKDFWMGFFICAMIVILSSSVTLWYSTQTAANYTPGCGLRTYHGTGYDSQTGHQLQIDVNLPVQCSPTVVPSSH